MYLVKTPALLKWYYSGLIWNKSRKNKTVYLTFDDGPIPDVTPFVLKTLKSFNAKATFFCIGDNIIKHREIYEQLKKDGHQIGNHTFNHLRGWATADTEYMENVKKCQQLTGTHLFRPPHGRIKKSQIKAIKAQYPEMQIVMWDVLSGDFDTQLAPHECYENVVKNSRSGSIIVFHDSIKAFERLEYTLPLALKHLTEQGYQFELL